MEKVSIRSLANELGVSSATVSRCLSDKSGVSQDLRRKVLELANRRGYRGDEKVSRAMSDLRSKNLSPKYSLVVVGSEQSLWFMREHLGCDAMIEAAAMRDLSASFFKVDHSVKLQDIAQLKEGGADSVVLLTDGLEIDRRALKALDDHCQLLSCSLYTPRLDFAGNVLQPDFEFNFGQVCEDIIASGHSNVMVISDRQHDDGIAMKILRSLIGKECDIDYATLNLPLSRAHLSTLAKRINARGHEMVISLNFRPLDQLFEESRIDAPIVDYLSGVANSNERGIYFDAELFWKEALSSLSRMVEDSQSLAVGTAIRRLMRFPYRRDPSSSD